MCACVCACVCVCVCVCARARAGHNEAVNECQEILESEVHKCPIEDLRLVLEEGGCVPLRAHQVTLP